MIRLPDIPLSPEAQQKLEDYQSMVDSTANYAERVALAKKKFSQYNRKRNATFREVRDALNKMCSGVRRCAYCEDSCADEVEHIKPKNLYPEETFVWGNYLYACGGCNGPKNNQWAVFSATTGQLTQIRRARNDPVVPPEDGDPAFINPRQEDPFTFMDLDLIDTFYFVPRGQQGSSKCERATYTIKILGLNDREVLPATRKAVYHAYLGLLDRYIRKRDAGASPQELDQVVKALQGMGHRTVWEQIKSKQHQIPELQQLFDQIPEAFDW